jgi:hypothetical protein
VAHGKRGGHEKRESELSCG